MLVPSLSSLGREPPRNGRALVWIIAYAMTLCAYAPHACLTGSLAVTQKLPADVVSLVRPSSALPQAADTQAITSYVRHHIDSHRRAVCARSLPLPVSAHSTAAQLARRQRRQRCCASPLRPPLRSVESGGTPGWISVKTAAMLVMQIAYSNKDKLQAREGEALQSCC